MLLLVVIVATIITHWSSYNGSYYYDYLCWDKHLHVCYYVHVSSLFRVFTWSISYKNFSVCIPHHSPSLNRGLSWPNRPQPPDSADGPEIHGHGTHRHPNSDMSHRGTPLIWDGYDGYTWVYHGNWSTNSRCKQLANLNMSRCRFPFFMWAAPDAVSFVAATESNCCICDLAELQPPCCLFAVLGHQLS